MVRSNFTQARMSEDGSTLNVTGTSDGDAQITEMRVSVAAMGPVAPGAVGQDLAPLETQIEAVLPGPVPTPWTIDVPITPGMFSRGDIVLLAGGALHDPPTEGLRFEAWIGCTTVMLHDDEKPG